MVVSSSLYGASENLESKNTRLSRVAKRVKHYMILKFFIKNLHKIFDTKIEKWASKTKNYHTKNSK